MDIKKKNLILCCIYYLLMLVIYIMVGFTTYKSIWIILILTLASYFLRKQLIMPRYDRYIMIALIILGGVIFLTLNLSF